MSYKFNGPIKIYHNTILDKVNFSIDKGDFMLIVGKNGSGKSTLVKKVLDIIPIKKSQSLYSVFPKISYLSGEIKLDVHLSLQKNIYNLAVLIGVSKSVIQEVSNGLNLTSFWHRKVKDLSTGQKKLGLLGISLLKDAELLIFDEPFSGLDKKNKKAAENLIVELHKQGKTIILISHVETSLNFLKPVTKYTLVNGGKAISKKFTTKKEFEKTLSDGFKKESYASFNGFGGLND